MTITCVTSSSWPFTARVRSVQHQIVSSVWPGASHTGRRVQSVDPHLHGTLSVDLTADEEVEDADVSDDEEEGESSESEEELDIDESDA